MKISKKTDYALRTLSTLVEQYGRGPIAIRELAQKNDIPKRFLEHILLDLKEQGWVESSAGLRGGYKLAKPPGQITLGQVVRRFDGVMAPVSCVSVAQYERCSQELTCRFRRMMLEIRNDAVSRLDETTLLQVHEAAPVSTQEVFDDTLIGGAGI